jgi:hypothetical protein
MSDWKETEEVAAKLEQLLTPKAKVQHNVWLPVLKSRSGRKAQCDVVVTYGKPPRETITIVEVQDRNSKVKINTFRGWLGKKDEVGAQHLICVSRLPYPSSIIELAAEHGPSVRLMLLEELQKHELPEDLRWEVSPTQPYFTSDIGIVPVITPTANSTLPDIRSFRHLNPHDNLFIHQGNKTNLAELWGRYEDQCYIDAANGRILPGTHKVWADYTEGTCFVLNDRTTVPIRLFIGGTIRVELHSYEVSYEAYSQGEHMLTWIITLKDLTNGDQFKFPYSRDKDGRLAIKAVGVHNSVFRKLDPSKKLVIKFGATGNATDINP